MRRHGLTVNILLAVDLVTADGEQLRVDGDSEPELFWGLRGGGGNFGIATAFEFRLHAVGPMVFGGPVFWPFEDAPAVLRTLRDFAPDAPDELGITLALVPAPPAPFIPPERFGQTTMAVILVWTGDPAEGQRVLEPLRRLGSPIADAVQPVPYAAIQSMLDPGAPHGRHYYWKAHRLPTLPDAAIDVFVDSMAAKTSPFAQINGWAIGGAASRVDTDATAVGDREPGFELSFTVGWPPPDPDAELHVSWARDGWEAARPFGTGVYANFLSDEGAAGLEAAYGDRLGRLTALKDRWDPSNVFRLNANIPPSGG